MVLGSRSYVVSFYVSPRYVQSRLCQRIITVNLKQNEKQYFLTLITLALFDLQLDVAIDGADDVDCDLTAIKGGGYAKILCFSCTYD